jgi:hypothetical protein
MPCAATCKNRPLCFSESYSKKYNISTKILATFVDGESSVLIFTKKICFRLHFGRFCSQNHLKIIQNLLLPYIYTKETKINFAKNMFLGYIMGYLVPKFIWSPCVFSSTNWHLRLEIVFLHSVRFKGLF